MKHQQSDGQPDRTPKRVQPSWRLGVKREQDNSTEPPINFNDAGHACLAASQPRDGEFVVVIGPSSRGKSTLLKLIAGLLMPATGSVRVDGTPVRGPGGSAGEVMVDLARPRTLDMAETIQFSQLAGIVRRHLNASGAID
jgi:ABC-type taurine transport system ATPase subunit